MTVGLIEALDCPLWLVSSNGVRFRHPDDAALARVVLKGVRGDRRPSIAWNYRSDRCKAFTASFPPAHAGYRSIEPDTEGLVLTL